MKLGFPGIEFKSWASENPGIVVYLGGENLGKSGSLCTSDAEIRPKSCLCVPRMQDVRRKVRFGGTRGHILEVSFLPGQAGSGGPGPIFFWLIHIFLA